MDDGRAQVYPSAHRRLADVGRRGADALRDYRADSADRGAAPVAQASDTLDRQGDALTAADAERRESLLGIALLHLIEQGHQHPRAGGADGVADGRWRRR